MAAKESRLPSERHPPDFHDGHREMRQPPAVPELADKRTRRARVWTIGEIHHRGDVYIVTVQSPDCQDEAA